MREVPKVKSTTLTVKAMRGTAVMSHPKGKNDLNVQWIIRRPHLTTAKLGNGDCLNDYQESA